MLGSGGGGRRRAMRAALSGAAGGGGRGAAARGPPPPPLPPPGAGGVGAARVLRVLRASPAGGAVAAAAAALRAGGLVAVPTDTVYGVACLAQDSRALEALYRLKGRAGSKPLAICLPELEHVYRYCNVNVPDELLRDLLPGPVTLVLERSEALNKDLNPFTPLVGIRIPSDRFIRELARVCAAPLALTSANVSNEGSTLTVTEFQDLWPHLSLVIDGGPTGNLHSPECRLGSTVIDLSVPGKFKVIRQGCALPQTIEILVTKHGLSAELHGL